jgi:hypothetical protein
MKGCRSTAHCWGGGAGELLLGMICGGARRGEAGEEGTDREQAFASPARLAGVIQCQGLPEAGREGLVLWKR